MNKLCPHVMLSTTAALAWSRVAPLVKSVDNVEAFRVARPSALRVWRHAVPNESDTSDPIGTVDRSIAALGGYTNEWIVLQIWCGAHPTRAQLIAAVKHCHDRGYLTCGSSWFTGDYTQADWDDATVAGVDLYGPQAYWGKQGFTPWHALRYRQFWEKGQRDVAILECQQDEVEGGSRGGATVADLRAYNAELNNDPYVVGAAVYTCQSPDPYWVSFTIDLIVPQLMQGDTPMPARITVGTGFQKAIPLIGEFTESEIYHDQGKPTQTSLALAQNGYATYRTSTNEVIAYRLDGAVFADGGNHGDGSLRQIRPPFK